MHTYGSESKGGTRTHTHEQQRRASGGLVVPDRCRAVEKVGDSLRAESRRAALAKKKLMRDQQRLKDIMRHITASREVAGPRDLHRALNLVSAQYDVDLPNGYTRQLNGECVWWEMSRAPPRSSGSPCAFLGPIKARYAVGSMVMSTAMFWAVLMPAYLHRRVQIRVLATSVCRRFRGL